MARLLRKVRLQMPLEKLLPHWKPSVRVRELLPHYQAHRAGGRFQVRNVHRCRSARIIDGQHNVNIQLWCGSNGRVYFRKDKKRSGVLLEDVPEGERACRLCEERAYAAGFISAMHPQRANS